MVVKKKDERAVHKGAAEPKHVRAPPPVVENPAKVKVKKEDVLCHLSFFIVILVLYFSSFLFFSKKEIRVQQPSIFSDLMSELDKSALEEKIIHPQIQNEGNQIILKGHKGDSDAVCSLFIAKSAIPNSGYGIFTTKAIADGETILRESIAISIDNMHFSPHLLYMKHHAEYSNTSGGIGGTAIVAIKNIEEGDELYFNIDNYPKEFGTIYRKLHPSDPSEDTYQKVDQIINSIIESIPIQKVGMKPKKKKFQKRIVQSLYKDKPVLDSTPFFQLMRRTLKEYDEAFSNLIPENDSIARSIIQYGGRSMYIQKNRSVESLIENGICVNGIQPSKSTVYERDNGGITTRSVKKGEVITSSPILATSDQNDARCLKVDANCSVLCFLSFSSPVNEGISASDCNEDKEGDCPYNKANAHYQWSEFNKLNERATSLSILDLTKTHAVGLTMDIIASRDIEKGEEVIIDFETNEEESKCSPYMIRKDMLLKMQGVDLVN